MPIDIRTEPVRGGFFDPRLLALPALDRMRMTLRSGAPPPPIHYLTGLTPTEVGMGSVTFAMPASPWLATPVKAFIGGWSAFVADAPLGGAVMTTLPPGGVVTTSQLTMNFFRPASVESKTLIARARLVHGGSAVGFSEVAVEDGEGRLLAHGTSRLVVLRLPVPDGPPPESDGSAPSWDTPHPYQREVDVPAMSIEDYTERSGYEVFVAFMKEELPPAPFTYLLGLRTIEVAEGAVACSIPSSPWLCSPAGVMYGGALAVFGDAALGAAFHTALPARSSFGTLDISMHFLRPVPPDGRDLIARARVVHRGRSLAVGEAEIANPDGKLVARLSGSALLRPGRPWPAAAPLVLSDERQDDDADAQAG